MKPALRSELYIKTGLVLLGAEILFGNILNLGLPGLFVAWLVTPMVIIVMYQFGVRLLKIGKLRARDRDRGCDIGVRRIGGDRHRGRSAGEKEELTLAVGISLIFTVVMMVLMPIGIRATGMDPIVGAAWIGGTIDATGAVVAARSSVSRSSALASS